MNLIETKSEVKISSFYGIGPLRGKGHVWALQQTKEGRFSFWRFDYNGRLLLETDLFFFWLVTWLFFDNPPAVLQAQKWHSHSHVTYSFTILTFATVCKLNLVNIHHSQLTKFLTPWKPLWIINLLSYTSLESYTGWSKQDISRAKNWYIDSPCRCQNNWVKDS